MADATKLYNFKFFEWSRPDAPAVILTASYTAGDTDLYWSAAPKDEDGNIIDGGFSVAVQNESGYAINFWIPAGAVSDDGLSASGVVVQNLAGTDYDTVNSSFDVDLTAGLPIFRVVSPVEQQILVNTVQGLIATGGASFVIGTEGGAETITLYRTTTAGVRLGVIRWFLTSEKVEFSNDGSVWTAIDDTVASTLVDVSATDTTPGYLLSKLVAGDNVTLTQNNIGGNETITVAASSQREGVTTHQTYTPAFLTGGTPSIKTVLDSVSDGSFRATDIDGTAYNVDGIDLTGAVDEAAIAAILQADLRAVTGGLETVEYTGGVYVFSSVDTTAASAFGVLTTSTGTVGTDISGAGGTPYLNANTGNGTETDAVIDPSADQGKVPLLNANGNVDTDLLREIITSGGYTAKGEMVVATGADTPALHTPGSNGQLIQFNSAQSDGIENITPLYGGVGNAALSGVETYQLPWFDPGTVAVWSVATAFDSATYAYNWAYFTETGIGAIISNLQPFNAYSTGNPSSDSLKWGDAVYTTVIAQFQFQFAADTAIGANGFGFGFVSNASSLTDYDDATNEGANFAVDASGNLYAHTSNGSSSTETQITGITLANRNTYRIEFDRGSEARFYVNGTLEATVTTTLPSGTAGGDEVKFGMGLTDNGGTVEAAISAINVGLIR